MTKGDHLLQAYEAQLSKLRIANQMLRDELKEEVSARAETKRVKDELAQVQDMREQRSLSNENSLLSDKMRLTQDKTRLIEQASTVESVHKELKAKALALQTLEAKRKRQLQVLREQLLTAQRLSESLRKERDAFKDERDALEAHIDRLTDDIDQLHELKEDSDTQLAKANARSDKLLGERTKVSAALQDYRRRIKEQSTVAQRNITVLQQKIEHLQSLHQTSLAEVRTVEALAEARHDRNQAVHQQHIDLQRKYDSLNADWRV
jgi:chromosome segregation ATPase